MSGYLYLCVQAYGDNVVSLRLLQEVPADTKVRILGTQLTREIADVLAFDRFPMTLLPKGMFAVYNVGDEGLLQATRDFLALRTALREHVGPDTTLLFENQRRPGTHRLLHLATGRFRYEQPRWGTSAYADRREMFERVFGLRIQLPLARAPGPDVRKVVIAPAARKGFRAFPHETVADLLAYFGRRGTHVCLVDAQGTYQDLAGRAGSYLAQRALATSAAEMRQSDLVIAPDSLFLHLAYALGIPAIALVPPVIAKGFYFAPPGLVERNLALSFERATTATGLDDYLNGVLIR